MSADNNNPEAATRRSADFAENAILRTLIPHSSTIDIESEMSEHGETEQDVDAASLSHIKERRLLYFDETLTVYIVLQIPHREEGVLRAHLSRLVITLEAHAVNLDPPPPPPTKDGQAPAPVKSRELLYSGSVNESDDPIVALRGDSESDEDGDGGHVLAIWKLSVFLARPRVRMQNPVINFTANASLRPEEQATSGTREEEYLPSKVPASLNLLESFKHDPALGDVTPRLSAMRVSRVMPATRLARELRRPLRNSAPQSIRAVPAVSARVRYSKLTGHASRPSVIASLDFEVTPMAQCNIRLEHLELRMAEGTCEDLMGLGGMRLPLECRPRDDLTFLYRLTPDESLEGLGQTSSSRALEIRITVTALVSDDCQPTILMRWRANIDLSATLNPSFGGPSPSLQRSRRPTLLGVAAPGADPTGPPSGTAASDASRSGEDMGLTLSISGPEEVYQGRTFTWTVFIVNRSSKARKLALLVMPNRRRGETKESLSRKVSAAKSNGIRPIAEAVLDENSVYELQRGLKAETTELVSLSTDVRVGPLAPSACHTADLIFLALGRGVLHVDAVRVVDLVTQQATDIHDLPSIACREDPES